MLRSAPLGDSYDFEAKGKEKQYKKNGSLGVVDEQEETVVPIESSSRSSRMTSSFRMRFFSRSYSASASKSFSTFDASLIHKSPEIRIDQERFQLLSLAPPSYSGYLWRKSATGMKSGWKKSPDFYQIRSHVLLQFRNKNKFSFRKNQKNVVYSLYRIVELRYCTVCRIPGEDPVLCLTHTQSGHVAEVLLAAYNEELLGFWLDALKARCNCISLSEFDPICKIGEGEWGSVCIAQRGERIFAVKEIEVNFSSNVHHLIQERQTMTALSSHPFIVNLHYTFREENFLYLVLDFAAGGDLFTKMQKRRPTKGEAVLYAAEILLALEHLHHHQIVYRDLKPENILLGRDGHIQLADMGLARQLQEGEYASTFCGTESYLAPEILKRLPYRMSVDFWQYGCLVFELYCGRSPFWKPRHLRQNLHTIITKGVYKIPANVPKQGQSLVSEILQVNPLNRLGCGVGGWAAVKSHAYFSRTSFEDLMSLGDKPAEDLGSNEIRHFLSNFDNCFTNNTPEWKSASAGKDQTLIFHDELVGFEYHSSTDILEGEGEYH
mmetsp:Transcript_38279/g.50448  ORF Transcript_38279/g.50448 Transcript_38279/m.50448 type:complete len:549 (+) Transcript_38279:159-1805(+)